MSIAILLTLGMALWGANFYFSTYNKDYMDKYHTTAINGIFIILVFISHFKQYVKLTDVLDKHYVMLQNGLGQLIVALFMFYSGYGIMCSIKAKGEEYIKQLPKNRIFKILIHFDIAVCVYLLLRFVQHKVPALPMIIKSFFAYKSLGNSDWYIFAILTLWVVTYIVYRFVPITDYYLKNAILTAVVIGVILVLMKVKPHWWYDTMLCYNLGMYYCLLKEKIDSFMSKNMQYAVALVVTILGFVIASKFRKYFAIYELRVLLFCLIVVFITMKWKINSYILNLLGTYLFEIYILMRLPMILLRPYFKGHNYQYFIACVVGTAILTFIFSKLYKQLDIKLFKA